MRTRLGLLICLILFSALPATADSGEWMHDVTRAFAASRATGNPVLVDLYADWCVWCKRLDQDVFSTDVFKTYTRRFVRLRVNVDDHGEGAALQQRYEATELPTMLILTPRNSLIGRVVGYFPTEQFVGKLETAREQGKAFEKHYQEASRSDDPLVLQHLAIQLHDRADARRAREIYERLLQQPEVPAGQRRWMGYLIADCLRLEGKFDASRSHLLEVRKAAKAKQDGELLGRLEQLDLLLGRDRTNCDSIQALEEFLAEYPKSSWRGQAKHLLQQRKQSLKHACA
jgi:thioredoxin-like negative regulator of GroEL